MAIETDIIDWALERPAWQQDILVSLAKGEVIDDARITTIANQLLASGHSDKADSAKNISLKSSTPQQVQVTQIANAHGVNALVDGQELSFSPSGVTIVYGDNGSGKSGYARLIKGMVSARHSSVILPDVFSDEPADPTAELTYTVDGNEKTLVFPDPAPTDLLKMSFYDEHCGTEYLTKQSTITYRPSALYLFDGLIDVCDRVRGELQERIQAISATGISLNLPPQTTAGTFLLSITAKTSDEQIDRATQIAPDIQETLSTILKEIARLTASDPNKERARLSGLSQQLGVLARDISEILEKLSPDNVTQLVDLKDKAKNLRKAAKVAASKSFDGEPVEGVGSDAWRALWEAARNYSVTEAYHDHDFPMTNDGAKCVFCHQVLGEDAKQRLTRFEQYMTDTTEQQAIAAAQSYQQSYQVVSTLVILSQRILLAVSALTLEDEKLGNAIQALVDRLESQKLSILAHLNDGERLPQPIPPTEVLANVTALATDLRERADRTDATKFQKDLADQTKQREELQASIRLSEAADMLRAEVKRLQELAILEKAKSATDTSAITLKSAALTREYSTKLILDQFTRETDRLKLERVTLEDLGGQKGQLNHKPGLLGAKHGSANARLVLSEGEQTALGLAGFFTEAVFDESKSAVIFDDPVTSLDHVRRDYVAGRLAQLASDRQVVVFTHDVSFVGDLMTAAERENVEVTQRSIERRGSQPGACLAIFPWKAKDFGSRVDTLTTALANIKRDRENLTQTEYEERTAAWAGQLSETWERSVSTEIINHVFERGKSEVRPKQFKIFAGITDADNQDFQDGYSHASKWARRHDKSPETNYVAPEPDDMDVELRRIIDWQKRIKAYRQQD